MRRRSFGYFYLFFVSTVTADVDGLKKKNSRIVTMVTVSVDESAMRASSPLEGRGKR